MTRGGHNHRAVTLRAGAVPAGGPRGSSPAEEYAAGQRAQRTNAHDVMDLHSDQFLVVTKAYRGRAQY
ncbi:hypothetical protein [Streptomyces sp. NPDC001410]|uniref:hypothetical protein n=1 Tax=Streptomyces sp. NPDC001410 TaxID=3364574 RepID=UPI0036757961